MSLVKLPLRGVTCLNAFFSKRYQKPLEIFLSGSVLEALYSELFKTCTWWQDGGWQVTGCSYHIDLNKPNYSFTLSETSFLGRTWCIILKCVKLKCSNRGVGECYFFKVWNFINLKAKEESFNITPTTWGIKEFRMLSKIP